MTPCVVELVSSTDGPNLSTTQELPLRSVSFKLPDHWVLAGNTIEILQLGSC